MEPVLTLITMIATFAALYGMIVGIAFLLVKLCDLSGSKPYTNSADWCAARNRAARR
jgi:hypothetical protein